MCNSGRCARFQTILTRVVSFAHSQPIMLPMLIEMPNGRDGAKILSWAVRFTILVSCCTLQ
jgi:hypothetical protein